MLREIRHPHESYDGVMRDFCDGEFVKTHPVLRRHRNALQILFYHDDIEVANPLGAKAGLHKLGKETICPIIYPSILII